MSMSYVVADLSGLTRIFSAFKSAVASKMFNNPQLSVGITNKLLMRTIPDPFALGACTASNITPLRGIESGHVRPCFVS